jgi:hypothetical protein
MCKKNFDGKRSSCSFCKVSESARKAKDEMNKEVLAKWDERAKPSGLHRIAFLKGIYEYREALRTRIEKIDTYSANEVLMKRQLLLLLETVEPLPLPPVEEKPFTEDDNPYFI